MKRIMRRGFLAAGAGAFLTLGGQTRSAGAALSTYASAPHVSRLASGVSPERIDQFYQRIDRLKALI